jgi:hypothetical protein
MSLLDANADELMLGATAAPPVAPKKQAPRFSMWGLTTAAPKGLAAGLSEAIGSTADILGAYGSVMGATDARSGGMFSGMTPAERTQNEQANDALEKQGPDYMSNAGRSFRNVAKDYMPDPLTAHGAEVMVGDFARIAGKAITAGVTLGPLAGAVVAGAEEGFTASDKLAQEGVDLATRTKVGALTGVVTAAGLALPVAGRTAVETVGLALAGGPISFIQQQQATRQILQDADYTTLGDQYDPFDLVGLALSTLLPLGFGAMAMRGARTRAKSADAETIPASRETPQVEALAQDSDQVTAARVSLLRENMDRTNPLPDDMAATQAHGVAYERAIDQMAAGERVSVADAIPEAAAMRITQDVAARVEAMRAQERNVDRLQEPARQPLLDLYAAAEREKPQFDSAVKQIAESVGGSAKLAELKGIERAVEKVLADYAGDPTKIKDLLRATIVVDLDGAQGALAAVMDRYEVTGSRNLLDENAQTINGYRDAKVNVLVNGHVAEIQISTPQMMAAKKQAHPLYVQASRLIRETQGKTNQVAMAKIADLQAQQRAIYDAAWADSTSARKAAGDTSLPLRTAELPSNTRGGSVSQAIEYLTPGQSGLRDTGMPSTSINSALGPNTGKSISTSTTIIRDNPSAKQAGEITPTAARLADLVASNPKALDVELPTTFDSKGNVTGKVTARDFLAQIQREAAQDTQDASLLQVAANCFLSG